MNWKEAVIYIVFLLITLASVSGYTAKAGEAFYELNQSGVDSYGQYNLSELGTVVWVSTPDDYGIDGKGDATDYLCIEKNDSNSFFEINSTNEDLGFSARVNLTSNPATWMAVASNRRNGGFTIRIDTDGYARCDFYGTTSSQNVKSNSAINDSAWHTITCNWDNDNNPKGWMILDGVNQSATTNIAIGATIGSQCFVIGGYHQSSDTCVGDVADGEILEGIDIEWVHWYNQSINTTQQKCLTNSSNIDCEITTYNLTPTSIAYYSFDTDAREDMYGQLNGTVSGATHNTTRYKLGNGSYEFSGSDFINLSTNSTLNLRTNYTINTWVYTKTLSTSAQILLRRNASTADSTYDFGMYHGGVSGDWYKLYLYNSNNIRGGSTVPLNQWVMITVTLNSSNHTRVYINGNLNYNASLGIGTDLPVEDTLIGLGMIGNIDELGIWKGVASADEIKIGLYDDGTACNPVLEGCGLPPPAPPPPVNSVPTIPVITSPTNNTFVNTTSIYLQFNSTDADDDLITYNVYGNEVNASGFEGYLAYWKMEDNKDVLSTYDFTEIGSPEYLSGKYNNAGHINTTNEGWCVDGVNDVMNFAGQDFSMGMWFNTSTNTSSSRNLILKLDGNNAIGYTLFIRRNTDAGNENKLWFEIYDGTTLIQAISTAPVNDGLWHHVVASWNTTSKTAFLYIDGSLNNSATNVSMGNFNNSNSLSVGGYSPNGLDDCDSFAGSTIDVQFDEIKVYDFLLVSSEISGLYNNNVFNTGRVKTFPLSLIYSGTNAYYNWTNLTMDEEYVVRMQANDSENQSRYSGVYNWTLYVDTTPVSWTNLGAYDIGTTTARIYMSSNESAENFTCWYGTSSGNLDQSRSSTASSRTTHYVGIDEMSAHTIYYYKCGGKKPANQVYNNSTIYNLTTFGGGSFNYTGWSNYTLIVNHSVGHVNHSQRAKAPNMYYDEYTGQYYMLFQGGNVSMAYPYLFCTNSSDGITWNETQKQLGNLTSGASAQHGGGTLLKDDDGSWKFIYDAYINGSWDIYLGTANASQSPCDATWTFGTKIFNYSQCDDMGVYHITNEPEVIKKDGVYHLWVSCYSASDDASGVTTQYINSTDLTSFIGNSTKVINATGVGGRITIYSPECYESGDDYYQCIAKGRNSSGASNLYQLWYFNSTGMLLPPEPAFDTDGGVALANNNNLPHDDTLIENPSLLKVGDKMYLYFASSPTDNQYRDIWRVEVDFINRTKTYPISGEMFFPLNKHFFDYYGVQNGEEVGSPLFVLSGDDYGLKGGNSSKFGCINASILPQTMNVSTGAFSLTGEINCSSNPSSDVIVAGHRNDNGVTDAEGYVLRITTAGNARCDFYGQTVGGDVNVQSDSSVCDGTIKVVSCIMESPTGTKWMVVDGVNQTSKNTANISNIFINACFVIGGFQQVGTACAPPVESPIHENMTVNWVHFANFTITETQQDNLQSCSFLDCYDYRDLQPTQSVITYPADSQVINASPLNVTWDSSYEVGATIYYNLSYSTDNSSWTPITRITSLLYSWNVTPINDSVYYLLVEADDSSLISDRDTSKFELDLIPSIIPNITANAPQNNSINLSTDVMLNVSVKDEDSDNMTVIFYGRNSTVVSQDSFTFIIFPDTQDYADKTSLYLKWQNMSDWVVLNQSQLNIQALLHVGDIVNNYDNYTQWNRSDAEFDKLDSASIPYIEVTGNHDNNVGADWSYYNQYYNISRISGYGWYGGSENASNKNNYYTLHDINGTEFVIVVLGYPASNSEYPLDWARSVFMNNTNKIGILLTHSYLDMDGTFSDDGRGQYLYDNLVSNASLTNLKFVFCGHHYGDYYIQRNVSGKIIHEILTNYQDDTHGGDGQFRILTFYPTEDRIESQVYSSTLDRFNTSSHQAFNITDIDLNPMATYSAICTNHSVANGSTVLCNWSGLDYNTTYDWYSEAVDELNNSDDTGSLFFTTEYIQNIAPNITGVAILNSTAYTDTNLVGECNATDDGNLQALSYTYDWYKNNVSLAENSTTLSSSNFVKGDVLIFECAVTDGEFTTVQNSSPLSILNTALTFDDAIPVPDQSLFHTGSFTVQLNVSDLDSDSITYDTDSVLISINASGYINSSAYINTDKGNYTIKVNATDGTAVINDTFNLEIKNNAPIVDSINILNSTAYTDTNLVGECNASDGDSDSLSYTYDWYKNNVSLAENSTTLSSSNFVKGDVLIFECAVTDGEESDSANSSTVTILNTAPTEPVWIKPTNLTVGAYHLNYPIIMNWTASSDADNDSIIYILFHKTCDLCTWNHVLNTTNTTYDWYEYINYNKRHIKIIATDGLLNSTEVNLSSDADRFDNVVPTAITDKNIVSKTNDSIKVRWYHNVVDEQFVTIKANGVFVVNASSPYDTQNYYNITGLTNNTLYNITFLPYDNFQYGVESSLLYTTLQNNAPPSVDAVTILNTTAYTDTNLVGECNASDPENDSLSYTYDWHDGSSWLSINSTTLNDNYTSKGDIMTFQCNVTDGEFSDSANSTTVTILNTAPTDPILTYPTGGEVVITSPLNITWITSTDLDSDILYYNVSYSTDNSSYTPLTRTNLTYYEWNLSAINDSYPYYVKVITDDGDLASGEDQSTAFRINKDIPTQPNITYPNGAEFINKGDVINVSWTNSTSALNISYYLDYSADNGSSWTPLTSTASTNYLWNTSGATSSAEYLVGVKSGDGYANSTDDESDDVFTINDVPTDPILLYPISGEVIILSPINITWNASTDGDVVYYNLSYSTDNSSWTPITRITLTYHLWDISALPDGTPYYIKIIADDTISATNSDVTPAFIINIDAPTQPVISYPNGGEQIDIIDVVNVTWSASVSELPVIYELFYSDNNGANWTGLTNTSNIYYLWDTTGRTSSNSYLMRVRSTDSYFTTNYDESNAMFQIAVPLAIQWDTKTPNNESYHANDINMIYELQTGDTDIDCDFYVNGTLNQSGTLSSLGDKVFTYDVTLYTPVGGYYMVINCSNAYREDTTSIKLIYIDIYDPTINVTSPTVLGKYYAPTGLLIDILFSNLELDETQVLLYESTTLKFNDTQTGIIGASYHANYTINYTDLAFGDMSLQLFALDDAGQNSSATVPIQVFNCTELVEDWQPSYTTCNTSDQYILYYTDANECETDYDFPVDNNTVENCNYCTVAYHEVIENCTAGQSTHVISYVYDNFATCCNLTGIPADCDIPANYTTSCVGQHQASDISGVVVDGLVEVGIEGVKYAPFIAFLTVASYLIWLI